eukprot:3797514-Amphidinium_carterae.2
MSSKEPPAPPQKTEIVLALGLSALPPGVVQELHLSPLHKCCLLTEAVALPGELNKVPCRLVSLVPALMVINKSDYCIGSPACNSKSQEARSVCDISAIVVGFWCAFPVDGHSMTFVLGHDVHSMV